MKNFQLQIFKFQYLKAPKLAQMDIDNGPSSSAINCNTLKNIPEITIADVITPSTFRTVSSFNNWFVP